MVECSRCPRDITKTIDYIKKLGPANLPHHTRHSACLPVNLFRSSIPYCNGRFRGGRNRQPPQKKKKKLTNYVFLSHFVSECLKIKAQIAERASTTQRACRALKQALDPGCKGLRSFALMMCVIFCTPPPPPPWRSWIWPWYCNIFPLWTCCHIFIFSLMLIPLILFLFSFHFSFFSYLFSYLIFQSHKKKQWYLLWLT